MLSSQAEWTIVTASCVDPGGSWHSKCCCDAIVLKEHCYNHILAVIRGVLQCLTGWRIDSAPRSISVLVRNTICKYPSSVLWSSLISSLISSLERHHKLLPVVYNQYDMVSESRVQRLKISTVRRTWSCTQVCIILFWGLVLVLFGIELTRFKYSVIWCHTNSSNNSDILNNKVIIILIHKFVRASVQSIN